MQISQWKSSSATANLVPFPHRDSIDPDAVHHAVDQARVHGFGAAYTAALTPTQAEPFFTAGFELVEELHLLRCRLDHEPEIDRAETRRGRRVDWPEVLELDHRAFDEFWQFDRAGLTDAMRATPRHRFQVTKSRPVRGYHVTGMAGTNSYVQRVAVHPDAQGQGWGTSLVLHSLWWAFRNGATTAHVNTQLHNERAVELYQRCGFIVAPYRLQVLRTEFEPSAQ